MYKINNHSEYFESADEETRKQFNMVKNLSKNFTIQNKVALQLDDMLMQLMEVDNHLSQPEVITKPARTKPAATQRTTKTLSIEDEFNELFEALKVHTQQAPPASITSKQMETAINEALSKVKIKYGDLADDLQERFSHLPTIIQYELPDRILPEFTKPAIGEFQQMVDDLVMGNNVFLVGGAGTGKSYTSENLLAKMALGRQYTTINCSQWTSPTEIIGGQTMDGYVEGKLIEAWKNGWVLILDELPKIDPNTAGLFNDALSKTKLDKSVIFNARKESFIKHPDFACIATGNIYPDKESMMYGANNKQDMSLLDRFSGSVYFVEKNPFIEKQIIQNDMLWSVCDKMRSVIEELKYEAQLSLRFMQTARDAYQLEMKRLGKPNGITANDGKTFKSAIDSYLSPFTGLQQGNIKSKIRYSELFERYQYRTFDKSKLVY